MAGGQVLKRSLIAAVHECRRLGYGLSSGWRWRIRRMRSRMQSGRTERVEGRGERFRMIPTIEDGLKFRNKNGC